MSKAPQFAMIPQQKQGALSVKLGGDAANEAQGEAATASPTLDALRARIGEADATVTAVAFHGYDAQEGLTEGQAVASERILEATPAFVAAIDHTWNTLVLDSRKQVKGFVHGFLATLVTEGMALRDLNARYDREARVAKLSRAECEQAATTTLREGREARDEARSLTKRFVPPSEQAPLEESARGAETATEIALGCEMLSNWLARWLGAMPADVRAVYEAMGFDGAMVTGLRTRAAAMREAQENLDALNRTLPVTQRQLDEQDGRVLHLIGIVHAAFRAASKTVKGVAPPPLGALRSYFERPSGRRAAADKPADPPAPSPSPA